MKWDGKERGRKERSKVERQGERKGREEGGLEKGREGKGRYHCKNTWVALTTFLGCLSCISVTKQCYQIWFYWNFISEASSLVTVVSLFFQKTYLATFLAFLTQTTQPRNWGQMCKTNETTNLTRNANLYAFWKTILFWQKREVSLLHSVQIASTPWTLRVTHTKGMQRRWPKYG